MSYDISISDEDFNYTYNVAPMWYDRFKENGIREFYGMRGREALEILRDLRAHMEDNSDRLMQMNPENGWGDFWGALEFVNELIAASIRNPDEVWHGD